VLPAPADEDRAPHLANPEEATVEAYQVAAAVGHALTPLGVRRGGFWGLTPYHADGLPFALDALPDPFTASGACLGSQPPPRAPIDAPHRVVTPTVAPGDLPTLASLGAPPIAEDARVLFRPVGGETTARARLQHFAWDTDRLRTYQDTRNGLRAASGARCAATSASACP